MRYCLPASKATGVVTDVPSLGTSAEKMRVSCAFTPDIGTAIMITAKSNANVAKALSFPNSYTSISLLYLRSMKHKSLVKLTSRTCN